MCEKETEYFCLEIHRRVEWGLNELKQLFCILFYFNFVDKIECP